MKVHVEVTQEDIDLGYKGDALGAKGGCMVRRAFMRATEGAFPDAAVGVLYVHGDGFVANLPAHVSPRILSFDVGEPVKPFTFDLNIETGGAA